eukprot:14453735-Alexandrium_andersonii.AAC.1
MLASSRAQAHRRVTHLHIKARRRLTRAGPLHAGCAGPGTHDSGLVGPIKGRSRRKPIRAE